MVAGRMRIQFSLLFACVLFAQPVYAMSDFIEGQHYLTLKLNKSQNPEIREYFSFYCKPCFSQEPFMKDLAKNIPGRAKFIKNHVEDILDKRTDIQALLSKALITAEKMRIKDKVVDAIFKKIHVAKQDFNSANEIKALFLETGVSEIMYDSTASSFSVDIKYTEMKKHAEALKSQGHKTLPALLVNGKYMPLTTRITSMEQYKELIYFLLKQ